MVRRFGDDRRYHALSRAAVLTQKVVLSQYIWKIQIYILYLSLAGYSCQVLSGVRSYAAC
jgi:hypothetical protein